MTSPSILLIFTIECVKKIAAVKKKSLACMFLAAKMKGFTYFIDHAKDSLKIKDVAVKVKKRSFIGLKAIFEKKCPTFFRYFSQIDSIEE